MNCQDALSLLYDIIDKEASEIDTREVRQHLERCKDCFEVYRLEQSVQDFLNARLKDANPGSSHEALKTKIRSRLDQIDQVSATVRKPPFFRRTAALIAAAAGLVIVILGGFYGRDLYYHYTEYTPIERAHRSARQHPEEYEPAETIAAVERVRSDYGYALQPAVERFELIGGRIEQVRGLQMAHFLYGDDNNEVVSVFVVPGDKLTLNDHITEAHVVRHGIDFYDHHCRGCRLVYHRSGDVVVITASSSHELELLDFIPGQGTI